MNVDIEKIRNNYDLRDRLPLTDRLPITGQFGLFADYPINNGILLKSRWIGLGKRLAHHSNMKEIIPSYKHSARNKMVLDLILKKRQQ